MGQQRWRDHVPGLHDGPVVDDLANEQHCVTDPKPIVQPRRISSAEIAHAEEQTHRKERGLNDCRYEKIPEGDFTANRGNIIESAKRYPVVKRQKQYVKCLQSDKNRFQHGNGLTRSRPNNCVFEGAIFGSNPVELGSWEVKTGGHDRDFNGETETKQSRTARDPPVLPLRISG